MLLETDVRLGQQTAIMKVIFVSDNFQEAEILQHELIKHAPPIHIDISASVQDVLGLMNTPGGDCDIVLLDTSVSAVDAVNLATTIRSGKRSIGIAALVDAAEKERPTDLLKAGLDRYILKRSGYVAQMGDALQQAKDRRCAEPVHRARRVRLFFAGDETEVKRHLSNMPNVLLEPIPLAPDGTLQLPDTGSSPGDLIIIDVEATGAQTLKAVIDINLRAPDIPAIILTNPGDEDTAIQVMKAGAMDCIAKTEKFFARLLPAIERGIRLCEQAREKASLKSREDRLRQIVETMPAGVTMIDPDGTFIAINRAGLSLMGAARIEQIAGKNLLHLVPVEERERIRAFLKTVSGWNNASVRLDWKGLDGSIPGIEICAVPMPGESVGPATVLATLFHPVGSQSAGEIQKRCNDLDCALRESEARFKDLQDKHNLQQSRLESVLGQAESHRLAAEAQQATLQEALSKEKYQLEQNDIRNNDIAQWALVKQELEQKLQRSEEQRLALNDSLKESEDHRSQLAIECDAERFQWDSSRHELEQKYQDVEEQRAALQTALQESESRLAQLSKTQEAELSQHELARKEVELKYQTAEKQRAAFQDALHDAEVNLAQLIEKNSAEPSRYGFSKKKSEQKYQAAEKQRLALQNELHEAEASLAQLTGKYNSELAQWNLDRAELEQRLQTAEKEHAAALQSAVRETESRAERISEQNQSKVLPLGKTQVEAEQLRSDGQRLSSESADFCNRYQRLSRFTSAGIILAQRNGLVLECNDIAARMFGYAGVEDALAQTGKNPFRIYAFEGALGARLQQDGKIENIEWTSLSRNGRLIRIQECATLVAAPAGGSPLVERILIDISKYHKLGEEIRQAQKIESTRDLAAATVKSFKDLYTSLAHCGELLIAKPDDGDAVRRIAEALLKEANRGVKNARQFLSIAQKADRTPALLNLNEILSNKDMLLHTIVGEDIDLQIALAPHIGLVTADRNEIVQLIRTLLENSRETLPMGGTVTIETSNVEIDSPISGPLAGLRLGLYVKMSFRINGWAIQPEESNASIRAIVERMGGCLESIHDPNLGNIHKIYFPRIEAFAGQINLLSKTARA
jgi:PAS domain S-box-containing protein